MREHARWLVKNAARYGARSVRVTSVLRTRAQQEELWRNRARNPYPVAPPGSSYHERRLAFDIVTDPYSALYTLGPVWRQLGGFWSPTDEIHFQSPQGV